MDATSARLRSTLAACVLGAALVACGGADDAAGVASDSVTVDGQGAEVEDSSGAAGDGASAEERRRAREQLSGGVGERPSAPARLRQDDPSGAGPSGAGGVTQLPDDRLAAAVRTAAAEAGVPTGDVVVVRAEAVTWPNGGLGCPEPGMAYTEALVDGAWVVVEAGDRQVDLRSAGAGAFRVCPPGAGTAPVSAGGGL